MTRPGILVVDDRARDLLTLRSILESDDRDVVTASLGIDALRHLLARDFAVVVMDVVMPEIDGFELAAMVRARPRSAHTPIIFLTAAGSDIGAIYRAYSVGAIDYLSKPVDPAILRSKVDVFVELFEKAQQLRQIERRNRELELSQVALANTKRLELLANASAALSSSLDCAASIGALARLLVPAIADSCLVHLVDGVGDGGTTIAVHRDSAKEAVVTRLGNCLFETPRDEPELICEFDESLRAVDVVSAITAPVTTRQTRLGTLALLATRASNRRYDMVDLAMAAELGRRAGTAVENATLYRRAEQAVRMRDEFLSIASHELRTPLSALLIQLGTMERAIAGRVPGDDKLAKKVAAATRHTKRLTRLVDSLLDVSRLAAKQLDLHVEELDLSELVREVADRFADEAQVANSELALRATPNVRGRWDRLRVEQVVTNLISNALKYGRNHPIEVSVELVAGKASIAVRDHGIGISPQDQARIFDRFQRAAPAQHYGGLGLGLYITRQIVDAHGGAIEVVSELGVGSTFTVQLPRQPEVAARNHA